MNLKRPEMRETGFALADLPLPEGTRGFVQTQNWEALDQAFSMSCKAGGELFTFLQTFHEFSSIETMISIRDAGNEWEEDGIWHDDGSRVFAFSLSLTENLDGLAGGILEVQNSATTKIETVPTPQFGTAILFLTGRHGFLHRIRKVDKGVRTILVGWCSE